MLFFLPRSGIMDYWTIGQRFSKSRERSFRSRVRLSWDANIWAIDTISCVFFSFATLNNKTFASIGQLGRSGLSKGLWREKIIINKQQPENPKYRLVKLFVACLLPFGEINLNNLKTINCNQLICHLVVIWQISKCSRHYYSGKWIGGVHIEPKWARKVISKIISVYAT